MLKSAYNIFDFSKLSLTVGDDEIYYHIPSSTAKIIGVISDCHLKLDKCNMKSFIFAVPPQGNNI